MDYFKKKNIIDEVKEFQGQYPIAKIIIFKYLEMWFKRCLNQPDWKEGFKDKPKMHIHLASEVERYLFGDDDNRDINRLENKEEVEMAKRHAPKWADDAMNRDKRLCEFITQTLRMDALFHQFFEGPDWISKNPRGKKVCEILLKYGGKVEECPSPKIYKRLMRKWMLWDSVTDSEEPLE